METDKSVVNLMNALKQHESGGDYTLPGKSGEYGAYQYTPDTFKNYASSYAKMPNANLQSPEDQDKVTYYAIKAMKDKGYTPEQVLSEWNSGKKNAYLQDHKGTNEYGVQYDTPKYVESVKNIALGKNPSSDGYMTKTALAPSEDQTNINKTDNTLISQEKGRIKDLTGALSDTMSGKINPVSGVLQSAGAIAGGLGDVVNKGIELIPGVKQVEDLIGQGVGTLAKTPTGQKVIESIQKFSNEHPELAKDIGAGFNIVTAIPILRGLGVVGKLGMEASSQALKNVAEKSFINSAPELIGTTQKATRLLSKNPNVFKEMVDRRLVGDIKGGKYVTQDAVNESWNTIKQSNNEIKKVLRETNANKYTIGTQDTDEIVSNTLKDFPNSNFTSEQILRNGKNLTSQNGKLWDKFIQGNATLEDINTLRSDLDQSVKSVYSSISQAPIKKELGSSLAGAMRQFVKDQAPATEELFNEMSTQFDIQKALSLMEGKSIKPGTVAKLAGHTIGMGAGGVVGGTVGGVPGAIVGGMIGEKTAGGVAKKLAGQNITQGILKRTGVNATKLSKKELSTKLGGLFGGAVSQKTNEKKQNKGILR